MNHQFKTLYTIEEAINELGIGRTSLYQEIKKGNLTRKKFGNKTLILGTSIEEWVLNLPTLENGGKGDE